MRLSQFKAIAAAVVVGSLLGACATPPQPYDYAAFKQSRPRSIVVLPPLNTSPDTKAGYGMLSQMSYPLAEAGYYVLPVAVVDETFKQNGLNNANDIHGTAPAKLREIFGADAALYVTVSKYGSSYNIISSTVDVVADARLVDLKTGTVLWNGHGRASTAENQSNNNGLIGMLVSAVVNQIANNLNDQSHTIAGIASQRMLSAGRQNGMLYGPYSPHYGKD